MKAPKPAEHTVQAGGAGLCYAELCLQPCGCRVPAWAFPAQMMLAGVKTGGTQRDSTISQPHESGVQALSWSSSAGGGFPWRSWRAFLQAQTPRGSRRHPLMKCHRMVTPDLLPSRRQGAQIKGSSMSPTGSPALSLLTQGSLLPGQAGHGIGDVWPGTPTAQG